MLKINWTVLLTSLLLNALFTEPKHHRRKYQRPPPRPASRLQSCFREFDKKFAHEWLSDGRLGNNLSHLSYLNLLTRLTGEGSSTAGISNYDLLRYLAPQLLRRKNQERKKKKQRKRKRKRKQSRKNVQRFWENAVWKGGIG